jgi:CubicO group peptidase (beta-lactamase class C family)
MEALTAIDGWDVTTAAIAVIGPDGVVASRGETDHSFRIASVSKPLVAYAAMVAVEEGAFELDDVAGPEGATVRHLLAHTAGYGFEDDADVAFRPGERRVYSNRGFVELGRHLEASTGLPIERYLHEAVLQPLGMASTELRGSPAHAVHSTVEDLSAFAAELLSPQLLASSTVRQVVDVQFPGLAGVLPGIGRFDPLDWGLGVERNFARPGHWAGSRVSRAAFGHFGGSGTFLWVDPEASAAAVYLGDRPFDRWALDAWPPLCDAIVTEIETTRPATSNSDGATT